MVVTQSDDMGVAILAFFIGVLSVKNTQQNIQSAVSVMN